MFVILAVVIGLALGALLSWYKIWQWEEVPLGKKIYQIGQPPLMYVGDMDNYGAMYYDGCTKLKFYMRGMWHTYKEISNNEQLMHFKGLYTYGWAWRDIWLIWSKGYGSAAEVVNAAKFTVDNCFNHVGA